MADLDGRRDPDEVPPHEGTAAREWRVLLHGIRAAFIAELALRPATASIFDWLLDQCEFSDTIEVRRATVMAALKIGAASTVTLAWQELETRGYVALGTGGNNRRRVTLIGPGVRDRSLAAHLRPSTPPLLVEKPPSFSTPPSLKSRAVAWTSRLLAGLFASRRVETTACSRLADEPARGDDGSASSRRVDAPADAESNTEPARGDDGSHGFHEGERDLSPMSHETMHPCHGARAGPVSIGTAIVASLDRVAEAQPAKIEGETQRLARELVKLGERIGRSRGTMHPVLLQRTVRAVADGKLDPGLLDEALLATRLAVEGGELRDGSPGKYFVACLQKRGFDPTRRQ